MSGGLAARSAGEHHSRMNVRHPVASLAFAGAVLASAPAHALAVFELTWSDVTCLTDPCDGRFVSATLHYHYSDDGLPLPEGNWVFPGDWDIPGYGPRRTNEVGALYLYADNFAARPLIFGHNDTPDSLSGELRLTATPTSPGGAGPDYTFVGAYGHTFSGDFLGTVRGFYPVSGIAPAIPEPSSVALMLAGLAALGLARRTRKR
jgi:hypothetical protein